MDFGHVPHFARVKFALPPEDASNALAPRSSSQKQLAYSGCPVWANRNWLGSFLPPHAKQGDFLSLYAQRLNSVELNTTHYRIPDAATVARWRAAVPASFRFVAKVPQQISHELQLRNAESPTAAFVESLKGFGETLGLVFLQLAPSFGPGSLRDLAAWLTLLPAEYRISVELRHPMWFQNGRLRPEAAKLFRERGVCASITDVAGRRDVLHATRTSTDVMIRFVGNELHPTDYSRIDEWIPRLRSWLEDGIERLFFFIHQPEETTGPELVNYFISKLQDAVAPATFGLQRWSPAPPPPQQMALF